MNAVVLLLVALSVAIVWALDRWLSRPMYHELTRFPGNNAALERYTDARKKNPQAFLPTATSEPRNKQWPLLTWNRQ